MSQDSPSFYARVGGRKQFNGFLYAVLVTVMAPILDATFDAYAIWLAAALLGTSTIVAMEDHHRRKVNGQPGNGGAGGGGEGR